ncbi:hypothetical protein ACFX13_042570 [Malus domestica]
MGLLALLIVRRLKNDMKKFSNSDEEETRRLAGNTFMVMFSDIPQTCHCFVLSWTWVPNCLPCKLIYHS